MQGLVVDVYCTDSDQGEHPVPMMKQDLGRFELRAAFLNVLARHASAKKDIPVDEPGLGKVGLDADDLVVYVVVVGCVSAEQLEGGSNGRRYPQ